MERDVCFLCFQYFLQSLHFLSLHFLSIAQLEEVLSLVAYIVKKHVSVSEVISWHNFPRGNFYILVNIALSRLENEINIC